MQSKTQKTTIWHRVNIRRLTLVVGIAALLSGVGVIVAKQLSRPDILPITELRLVGEFKNVHASDVKNIFDVNRHGNFLTLDVNRIHAAVSAVPWVHAAWVDRIWPNVLQVRIQEQKAVAVWANQKLINSEAQLFADAKGFDTTGLPVFTGPAGAEKTLLNEYQKIAKKLSSQQLVVSQIAIDARGSLNLTLQNGISLLIGRANVDARVERFVDVYASKFNAEEQKIAIVDMRYTNGLAIEWKNSVMSNIKARNTVGSL